MGNSMTVLHIIMILFDLVDKCYMIKDNLLLLANLLPEEHMSKPDKNKTHQPNYGFWSSIFKRHPAICQPGFLETSPFSIIYK